MTDVILFGLLLAIQCCALWFLGYLFGREIGRNERRDK